MSANPSEQQSRLDKIRALLAKAESTTHPAEAESFAAKAQELMSKWAIDDAMLDHAQSKRGEIIKHEIWLAANEFRGPKIRLLDYLSLVNDCFMVMYPQCYREVEGKRKRMFRCELVGHPSDLEFVDMIFASLLLQAEQSLLRPETFKAMQMECESGGHSIRWRNAFMNNYAMMIDRRMRDAKERARAQGADQYKHAGGQFAMVLASRTALVKAKFNEFYPKLKTKAGSQSGQHMGSAGKHGAEAGARADLGAPKVKGGAHGQIGGAS